jgi:hypothetical protein
MLSFGLPQQKLDPLDRELLERAFDAELAAANGNPSIEFDSDEGLEVILRRELLEIACFNGVSDPETLRELVFTNLAHPSGSLYQR